ncbi:MAG: RagB/SusD family nutrient uptake outer membrane protein [Chitinophagaceae bacterium]
MKNIARFFLLIVFFASCKKSLDTEPKSFVADVNFFNTKAEIEVALNAVYEVLFSGQPYLRGYNEDWRHCYLGTDESTSNRNVTNNDYPTHYNETSASTFVSGMWSTCFAGVNRANVFLENIDKSTSITEDERAIYKGEVKFLRAHYLFYLTQWFGDIPLRTSSTVSLADAQIAFTPSKEVYDYIIKEMTEAQDLLKVKPANTVSFNEKVTQTTVQGMLARVCLFAAGNPVNDVKRYQEASDWAQKVIKSGLHNLNPDYAQVFINHSTGIYDNVNRETMWQVTPIFGLSGASLREQWVPRVGLNVSTGIWGTVSGYERTNPRAYYTYTEGDIRRDWNISPFYLGTASSPTSINPLTYFAATDSKWSRESGKWKRYYEPNTTFSGISSSQAFPLLRYADVLLMFAEAESYVNGPSMVNANVGLSAVDAVNLVRRRGYGEKRGAKGVAKVVLSSPGSGYIAPPALTFIPGNRLLRTQTIAGRPYLNEDARATGVLTSGTVSDVNLYVMGEGYVDLPTIIVGTPWLATSAYLLNAQVVSGNYLYTVSKAGTSGTVAPTNTSGTFNSGTAIFTYAGLSAKAIATFASADLLPAAYASKPAFLKTMQDERLRELSFECLRRNDLKRWGILVATVKRIAQEAGSGSAELNANGTQQYGAYAVPLTSGPFNANINIFITGPNSISDKDNLLPIPNSEIVANKKAKQNPGF